MDSVRPGNPIKLLTLSEAAQKLSVTVEVLLKWNEHNILKPTITLQGQIGYTQNQIDQFMAIRQLFAENPGARQAPATPAVSNSTAVISSQNTGYSNSAVLYKTQAPVQEKYINQNLISGIADTEKLSIKHAVETKSGMKQPLSVFMVMFGVLFVILMSTIFLSPAMQVSKLKLTSDIASAIPVQINGSGTEHSNLLNAGENVMSDKISAPQLYNIDNDPDYLPAYPTNIPDPKENTIPEGGFNFARTMLSIASDTSCPNCTHDEADVIDSNGYIKGEPKSEALAMIVDNIDKMIKNETINPASDDPVLLMIFLSFGALTVMYVFYKQLSAYPAGRSTSMYSDRVIAKAVPTDEKILEVDQKTDGSVVVNFYGQEYKISKPEMNSESDQFIERLMSLTPFSTKEIEYDVSRPDERSLSTPLSRLVTRLGFVGIKRDLFFPRTSKCSVLFRKYLTSQDIADMNLTKEQILKDLTGSN